MRPRTDEILAAVLAAFEADIAPTITDPAAKSASLTMANLLRHVILRLAHEGDALRKDLAELEPLVLQMLQFFRDQTDAPALVATGAQIAQVEVPDSNAAIESKGLTAARDARLGQIDAGLIVLQQERTQLADRAGYHELRDAIRTYLRGQLSREEAWIVPAFVGARR